MRPVRGDSERGAVVVEFALLLPVVALMAYGIVEFGLAWQDRLTVQTGVRSGARVAAAAANDAAADQTTLLSLGAAASDLGRDRIEWVLIYKSATGDGAVPATCLTPVPHSVSGTCNAYSGSQVRGVVDGTAPAAWFGCGVGSLDVSWCPASRQAIQALGADYLGVWMRATHPMITGLFGSSLTVQDRAVMRLEPKEA